MKPFLTGSHVYGKPNKDSDVDIVIQISEEDTMAIIQLSAKPPSEEAIKHYGLTGMIPIRFGNLNLLICTTDSQFSAWKIATEKCKKLAPMDRRNTVDIFQEVFKSTL